MLPPMPAQEPIVTRQLLLSRWVQWFNTIVNTINLVYGRIGRVDLVGQQASLSATAIPTLPLTTGTYQVSYVARVTQAASSTSSLGLTIGWTDSGVACSVTTPAITGNTTATLTQGVVTMNADAATTLTYATTYASTGGTPMQYALTLWAGNLP